MPVRRLILHKVEAYARVFRRSFCGAELDTENNVDLNIKKYNGKLPSLCQSMTKPAGLRNKVAVRSIEVN